MSVERINQRNNQLSNSGLFSTLKHKISTEFETYTFGIVVEIRHKYLKLWYCMFLLIFCGGYTAFFCLVFKSHLYKCEANGIASTLFEGAVLTNYTEFELNISNYELYNKLWDSQDLLTPPELRQMEDFTILTNVVITPNQTLGKCHESRCCELICLRDSDCNPNISSIFGARTSNGVLTGKCLPINDKYNSCEIYGWCPVPEDKLPLNGKKAVLEDTKNLFVVIKSAAEFPLCGALFNQTNVQDSRPMSDEYYLSNCFYSPKKHPWCPRFRLKDIVEGAGETYSEVAIRGAVFIIDIEWDCHLPYWTFNYDGSLDNYCKPTYKFSRSLASKIKSIAPGWKYSCGNKIKAGHKSRTHLDCYGLKFTVTVSGKGHIFTWKTFILDTVVSSFSLFFMPTLLIEYFLIRYCFNKDYRKKLHAIRTRNVEESSVDERIQGETVFRDNEPLNAAADGNEQWKMNDIDNGNIKAPKSDE